MIPTKREPLIEIPSTVREVISLCADIVEKAKRKEFPDHDFEVGYCQAQRELGSMLRCMASGEQVIPSKSD